MIWLALQSSALSTRSRAENLHLLTAPSVVEITIIFMFLLDILEEVVDEQRPKERLGVNGANPQEAAE